MNYFVFVVKSALFDFSRSKLKTMLTSLGIMIGVMSVVLLTAFGLGLKKYINDQFESLGTNLLRIVPGQILQNGSFRSGSGSFGGVRFDLKDYTSLKRVDGVEVVAPAYTKGSEVSGEAQTEYTDTYHSSDDVFSALNLNTTVGEVFTAEDVAKKAKVAVIGPKIAEKLFGDKESAVDKTINFEGQSFTVKGVLEEKGGGGFGGPDLDSYVYIPYTSGFSVNTSKTFLAFLVKYSTSADVDVVKENIKNELMRRYNEDDFSIIEQKEILGAISSIFGILNSVLVAIAAISLVVGGIGIMNIMYVTITERTREIGIRRALGARKQDILSQFLVESVILSLLGGLSGLGLSYLIVFFIQRFFPAYIDLQSIILALGVSSAIGIVFGVFPAKKASDLSPIDAIRYE